MEEGVPRYVTAVSQSDIADGWRDRRHDGGIVVDVASNEICRLGIVDAALTTSLPRPIIASQTRERAICWLGWSRASARFERQSLLSGLCARSKLFRANYAVVGLSKPRDGTFAD